MRKTKTISNLRNIFIQSYKWRNSNLSDKQSDKKFRLFSLFNIVILIVSGVIVSFGKKIDNVVLNSILTFASIFATLIIPVLIMVYDKFSNNPNSHLTKIQQQSSGAKARAKLFKNFTSRFIFTALENVFIAVSIIAIIIIYNAFLIDFMNVHPLDYEFQNTYTRDGIYLGLKLSLVFLLKSIFVLLLIKFILFIFYSIGALGDFFQDGLKNGG